MKKCVIYSRVASTMISNPRESIDYQNMECKKFAQSQGFAVANIFEDIAVSGTTGILNRLDEIIAYCKENGVHTLISTDFTRLCRMSNKLVFISKKFNENNIQVIFARNENSEKIAMQMMVAQAQFQSEIRSQKIKLGLAKRKSNL